MKAQRKPRPSMPYWWWLGQDGCWFCNSRNNCNQCKPARMSGKGKYKIESRRDKRQKAREKDGLQ